MSVLRKVFFLVALTTLAVDGRAIAQSAKPTHHEQAPGFFRLKLGDFEVTSLSDGGGTFSPKWLIGAPAVTQPTGDGEGLTSHSLDVSDAGFLVNTGKHLILVDAGTGGWWGGPTFGRLGKNLARAGYKPEQVDIVLVTHLHSDHIGGITAKSGGKRIFPNAEVYVSKADSDFWLSPEIAAKAPKEAQEFFQMARAISAPYVKAGKWRTFEGVIDIVDGVKSHPLPGHTPGHTGYDFTSQGQKLLLWGDTLHVASVQFQHPEVTVVFDINAAAAAAERAQVMASLAGKDTLVGGPHMPFPSLGRLRKAGAGYQWEPVTFSDEWVSR